MRLIDADTLKRKAQKVATEAWKMRIKSSVETILNQFIDWIDAQPTITTEPQWIPCSERLPEESGKYLVTVLAGIGKKTTSAPYHLRSKSWTLTGRMAYWKVIAWMPLPEPYRGGEQDDR